MKKELLFLIMLSLPMIASADDSGSCGDNITYYYEESIHALTISGEGTMDGYYINTAPWSYYSKDITSLLINEGVTTVGYYAFYGCSNITSLKLANSVTKIDNYAFAGCTGLSSLTLGPNIEFIGMYAFAKCSGLKKITIKSSPIIQGSVSSQAFDYCENINEVVFDCDIVRSWNFYNSSYDVIMTDKVITIDKKAFENKVGLKSITIGKNVESIGERAFNNCKGFDSLTVLGCPQNINSKIRCPELKEITYDCEETTSLVAEAPAIEKVTLSNKVKSIGDNTFSGFTELISIDIPNNVTNIGIGAFDGCSSINAIVLPKDLKSIGNYAFSGCTGLSSIELPDGLETIGTDAFVGCIGLTSITINEGISNLCGFSGCTNLSSINIPNSVTTIGESAFSGCMGLVSLTIPSSVTSIKTSAFSGCLGFTSFTIPGNVKLLGNSAFEGCLNLKKMIVEEGDSPLLLDVNNLHNDCFKDCPIEELYLGRDMYIENENQKRQNTIYVTYFEPFKDSQTLLKIHIGKNVTTINNNYFSGCTNLSSVTFSEGLLTIGGNSFEGCSSLESITLPSSLKEIGFCAFYGCNMIRAVKIPANVEKIHRFAFSCSNLDSVIIEDSYESLEFVVDYSNCTTFAGSIKSIYVGRNFSCYHSPFNSSEPFSLTIGKNVKELNGGAFHDLIGITTLKLEECSDTLTFELFYGSPYSSYMPFSGTSIDSVFLGRTIVGKYQTQTLNPFGASQSFHLEIGKTIPQIGNMAFYGWNISSVVIPNSVDKIHPDAFDGNYSLNSVIIKDGETPLEFIEGSGFNGCQLKELYIGRNVSYELGISPFKNNKEALSLLTIGNQVTEIGESQFVGLESLEKVEFPNSLKKIGKHAFYGCEALTSISIPNSVAEIGENAFDLSRSLKIFTIEDGEGELFINNNFLNSPLDELYVGRNITYPDANSPFSMLESLKKVTIGSLVSRLGDTQFAGCQNLKDVVSFSLNVPSTGKYVFTEAYQAEATLHVPESAYNKYQNTYPWYLFKNFQLIDENGTEMPKTIVSGDASGNGIVDAGDIEEIVRYIMNGPSEYFNFGNADMNKDGKINAVDIVILTEKIRNL